MQSDCLKYNKELAKSIKNLQWDAVILHFVS